MLATWYIPQDKPIGTVSVLAAVYVLAGFVLLWRPANLSPKRKLAVGLMMGSMLPLACWVLFCIRRESAHFDGIDELEAIVSFFILLAGAFGTAMAVIRVGSGWIVWEGLAVLPVSWAIIVRAAVDIRLVFPADLCIPQPLDSVALT